MSERLPFVWQAPGVAIEEVLLIGGSAGVGKSTVGWEVSVQLNRLQVAHWHLEGDVLDAAWPRPPDDQNGERMTVNTMRAMAGVFAAEGYTRCVHVQTASVIDSHLVTQALGSVRLLGVLLTASEATRCNDSPTARSARTSTDTWRARGAWPSIWHGNPHLGLCEWRQMTGQSRRSHRKSSSTPAGHETHSPMPR